GTSGIGRQLAVVSESRGECRRTSSATLVGRRAAGGDAAAGIVSVLVRFRTDGVAVLANGSGATRFESARGGDADPFGTAAQPGVGIFDVDWHGDTDVSDDRRRCRDRRGVADTVLAGSRLTLGAASLLAGQPQHVFHR